MVDLVDGEYKIYAVYGVVCSATVSDQSDAFHAIFDVNQASQLCRILLGFSTGDWADRCG